MRGVQFLLIVSVISLASGCANTNYKKSDVCAGAVPANGDLYIITDASEGFLSRSKDKWPSDLFVLPEDIPISLQCIIPKKQTSRLYQRRAVFEIEGSGNLVFGTTTSDGTPKGVMRKEVFAQAKELEGKTLWFTGDVGDVFNAADNLKPYRVKAITRPGILSIGDLTMVVDLIDSELKVPLIWREEDKKFGTPEGSYFTSEPSGWELKVPSHEIALIKEGTVQIGMSENAVYHSIGFPKDFNTSQSLNGTVEQWVYRNRQLLVYFDDSKTVIHIQKGY
jgi:hypothetical protein